MRALAVRLVGWWRWRSDPIWRQAWESPAITITGAGIEPHVTAVDAWGPVWCEISDAWGAVQLAALACDAVAWSRAHAAWKASRPRRSAQQLSLFEVPNATT